MSWIVDASVAAKWFFTEALTSEARKLLRQGGDLIAPELILLEVGSVAWQRVRKGEATQDHARAVATALPQVLSLLVPLSSLQERALDLALTLGHPVYDCCYLALAEIRELPLVTADGRLIEKLRGRGWAGEAVHLAGVKP